jgi:hypothetical protein
MQTKAPFGLVTSCYAGDKHMVQATLASMRYYCPRVPICLIVDGPLDVSDLEALYDLIVLRIDDLPDQKMVQLIARSRRAKLAAMWEGPFEHYVWMDSDAIVWGDFTADIRTDADFQIFWSDAYSVEPDAREVPWWLPHFYLEPVRLNHFDPKFEWRGLPYFSDGVFACKRNIFSFEEWQRLESWRQEPNSPWPKEFVTQPLLNYLVHSKSQSSLINVVRSDLQYLTRHVGREEIDRDTLACGWRLPKVISRPRVVHFCGQKPLILNWRGYSWPFTLARVEHYRKKHIEIGAWLLVYREEVRELFKKVRSRLKRAFA